MAQPARETHVGSGGGSVRGRRGRGGRLAFTFGLLHQGAEEPPKPFIVFFASSSSLWSAVHTARGVSTVSFRPTSLPAAAATRVPYRWSWSTPMLQGRGLKRRGVPSAAPEDNCEGRGTHKVVASAEEMTFDRIKWGKLHRKAPSDGSPSWSFFWSQDELALQPKKKKIRPRWRLFLLYQQ